MLKKIFALLLSLSICMCLIACRDNDDTDNTDNDSGSQGSSGSDIKLPFDSPIDLPLVDVPIS